MSRSPKRDSIGRSESPPEDDAAKLYVIEQFRGYRRNINDEAELLVKWKNHAHTSWEKESVLRETCDKYVDEYFEQREEYQKKKAAAKKMAEKKKARLEAIRAAKQAKEANEPPPRCYADDDVDGPVRREAVRKIKIGHYRQIKKRNSKKN